VSSSHEQRDFVRHLFERHRTSLLKHVASLLRSTTDAEDIVQETCARLLRTEHLEHDETRARSYMFRVATNLAYDRHRRRGERSIETLEPASEPAVDGPETIVDLDQAIEAITQTLLSLKPRCRQVFLLRTSEGMSYEAIAERLGISKRTVEREMKHGLDACQRRLKRAME
jgi:RNA polymerase sigma factor (sigma-70 family)